MVIDLNLLISENYAHYLFISGPYQPSNDMKLKFYGYYKQATQGQCNQTKPSFWDVVGRAKWSAWNNCENMTKDEAKQLYIDEIKKVILIAGRYKYMWPVFVLCFVPSYLN